MAKRTQQDATVKINCKFILNIYPVAKRILHDLSNKAGF